MPTFKSKFLIFLLILLVYSSTFYTLYRPTKLRPQPGCSFEIWLYFWSSQRRIMVRIDFSFGTKTTRKWMQSKRFSLFIFTHRRPNYQSVPWLLVRWVDYLHCFILPILDSVLTLLLSVEILSYRSHHAVKIFSFHWQIGYEPRKQCIKTVSKIGLMPN